MAEKKSFLLYLDNKPQFEMLSDAQAGILIKAIYAFADEGKAPEIKDDLVKMAFSFIAATLMRDQEKYEETCKRNAENGRKGGRPKKNISGETQKTEGFLKKPKKADSDSVMKSERDRDIETIYDSETERSASDTQTHTSCSEDSLFSEITAIVQNLGCQWTEQEIREFIAYNLDAGRHLKGNPNWAWAVRKWEENRCKRLQQFPSRNASSGCDDTADPYLAVSQKWMESMD